MQRNKISFGTRKNLTPMYHLVGPVQYMFEIHSAGSHPSASGVETSILVGRANLPDRESIDYCNLTLLRTRVI